MRACGVLLPVASLPSQYGIGGFSEEAYRFVDQLKEAGQSYWQVLPLGPTGFGDSPYQSFSTFAGNPYYIDLKDLQKRGYLSEEELAKEVRTGKNRKIDYEDLYHTRFKVLRKAFDKSNIAGNVEFLEYCSKNEQWLEDYALFMVIKGEFEGRGWDYWPMEYRRRDKQVLEQFQAEHKSDILFWKFVQYIFADQWKKLKEYANDKGVMIIGDIPIYVAFDSADSWSHPELFQFDENIMPIKVAGCPPDAFAVTGQLWGNPLYDWEEHKKTNYEWWLSRIRYCATLYDVIRIDHFRGFDEYYAIPYGDKTAEFGHWEKGPGMDLFHAVQRELKGVKIIAEDLGFLTDSVLKMLKDSGYPGMKVLEFAFNASGESDYLTYHYDKNCVVYTGTHDNETLAGWYNNLQKEDKAFLLRYLGKKRLKTKKAVQEIIRLAMNSVADTCIIPIQDYLGLGNEARINYPSTLGGNWIWQMNGTEMTSKVIQRMREFACVYGRIPKSGSGEK